MSYAHRHLLQALAAEVECSDGHEEFSAADFRGYESRFAALHKTSGFLSTAYAAPSACLNQVEAPLHLDSDCECELDWQPVVWSAAATVTPLRRLESTLESLLGTAFAAAVPEGELQVGGVLAEVTRARFHGSNDLERGTS